MDLRYTSLSPRTTNFGDFVIHHAIERVLERFLPRPVALWDIDEQDPPRTNTDCCLVPGITHLTVGERPTLERLRNLPYPAYCLSGCLWQKNPTPGFLLRTRVFHWRQPSPVNLQAVQLFKPPIGARDPHTFQALQRAGIETIYTGCATLLLPNDGVGDDGYVLFSLGRGHVREQTQAARILAREYQVIGICHETGDEARYRAAGWELPLVNWRGDVDAYLSYFKRASAVITGRLHGVLPSLAYGKRVFYFGTRDTRTSILDDLGVPIHGWDDLPTAVNRASAAFNRSLPEFYLNNWRLLIERIQSDCRRPARSLKPTTESHSDLLSTSTTPCVHA